MIFVVIAAIFIPLFLFSLVFAPPMAIAIVFVLVIWGLREIFFPWMKYYDRD